MICKSTGTSVGATVSVEVGVSVMVAVGVMVAVSVVVTVAAETPVAVTVGAGRVARGIFVFVNTGMGMGGLVLMKMRVWLAVWVGMISVLVFGGMLVNVPVGMGVRVEKTAPGVRKTLPQAGLVRMEGSSGSMKLTGRPVRKSLLGLRFEFMLAGSFQLGSNRSAQPLARLSVHSLRR